MAVTDKIASREGYTNTGSELTWSAARDATSAIATNYTSGFTNPSAIAEYYQTGRGSGAYGVNRTFMFFDVSSITSTDTISAITLKVSGRTNADGDVIVVKTDAFGGDGASALANGDHDSWDPAGTPVAYSSNVSSWVTSGRVSITLNSTAIANANATGYLNTAILGNNHDYPDNEPTVDVYNSNGIKFASSTTSEENVLTVTHATSGGAFQSDVNDVVYASSNKINGVTFNDIETINNVS
jgi:hypothetical protein